jgi:hypothetical protein
MKKNNLLSVLSCLLIVSCSKTYERTTKVCDEKLYVEIFSTGVGLDTEYLTDSVNFRLYVGKRDDEHENFTYQCKADSIFIKKIDSSKKEVQVLETSAYSLKELKNNKVFE